MWVRAIESDVSISSITFGFAWAAVVVTIGAGCLFGMLGLVLGAPLVSAAVRIAGELNRPLAAPPPADDGLIQTG
jgi:predicted PurR-regulated permease PerM